MSKLNTEQWLQRIETIHRMVERGATDDEIADAIGVAKSSIARMRPWAVSRRVSEWREIAANGGRVQLPKQLNGPSRHGGRGPQVQRHYRHAEREAKRRGRIEKLVQQGWSAMRIHRHHRELGHYKAILKHVRSFQAQERMRKRWAEQRANEAGPTTAGHRPQRTHAHEPRPRKGELPSNSNEAWMLRIERVLLGTQNGESDHQIMRALGMEPRTGQMVLRYARHRTHRQWVRIYENHGDVRPGWARDELPPI